MLRYLLIKNDNGVVEYRYMPEGGDDFGIVSYDINRKQPEFKQLAKDDKFKTYAGMMFKRIREFAKSGEFEESGMVAWY